MNPLGRPAAELERLSNSLTEAEMEKNLARGFSQTMDSWTVRLRKANPIDMARMKPRVFPPSLA